MGENEQNYFSDKKNKKKRLKRFLCVLLAIVAAVTAAFLIYAGDYYHAGTAAQEALEENFDEGKLVVTDERVVYAPDQASAGLIFYPGGKVEFTAYAPLMKACAQQGILCVLVRMPFNLAVLDVNAADGIAQQYPQIEQWYIGGHSLGGAMAAVYAGRHGEEIDGLVLCAAYSTEDLADSSMRVISIYGSEDGVLNRESYEKYRSNLPDDFEEDVIEGGCHSYFGCYGLQKGDGDPTITNEEQISQTASLIGKFINGGPAVNKAQ